MKETRGFCTYVWTLDCSGCVRTTLSPKCLWISPNITGTLDFTYSDSMSLSDPGWLDSPSYLVLRTVDVGVGIGDYCGNSRLVFPLFRVTTPRFSGTYQNSWKWGLDVPVHVKKRVVTGPPVPTTTLDLWFIQIGFTGSKWIFFLNLIT